MASKDPCGPPRASLLDRHNRGDVMVSACPSRAVLNHMTSRWGVLVLIALMAGPQRFSVLRREIGGISDRMLAQALQALEGDRLVDRDVIVPMPLQVQYSLTPLGQEAAAHLRELTDWIEDNLPRMRGPDPEPEPSARSTRCPPP
ncbi:winged helix-turn-helix transcriptional regulator [Mangrovicoccus algicola]|uniref:Helix-turn-helix transcriptional regulator n=1 Tax=Mangrovicoccus algicola TaxID=2771008 RepID=A0A8J7CH51_9RHOB|nr:helix-turn-helix domain-containing protein [Mangrovicoccus algicola]MBE3637860.1 helix-turn-helix transcriptional regulator [Mangrovicoccus algicola]